MTCTTISRATWIGILRRPTLSCSIPLQKPLEHSNFLTTSVSSQRPPWTHTRDLFIQDCLNTLYQHTRNPLWKTLKTLGTNSRTHQGLAEALHAASSPIHREVTTPDSLNTGDSLSRWVYIHHLTQSCETPADTVDTLVESVFSHISHLPVHEQAPMLIFVAAHLATWNLALPLRKVVDSFLSLPHPIRAPSALEILTLDNDGRSELYLNLFLRAMACTTKFSTDYATQVTTIISHLDSIALYDGIHAATYSALLNSTHNTITPGSQSHQSTVLSPYLATFLLFHMRNASDPCIPAPEHLEALLRFWAKKSVGLTSGSARREGKGKEARERVAALWKEMQGLHSPDPVAVEQLESANLLPKEDPVLRANTLYLGAQGSVEGTKTLLGVFNQAGRVPSPSLSAPPNSESTRDPPLDTETQPIEPSNTNSQRQAALQKLRVKPRLDAYDLTAILHSAANDPNVSTNKLIAIFKNLALTYEGPTSQSAKRKVPLATHTVYLRGLMFRGSWERARRWWERGVLGIRRGPWAAEEAARQVAERHGVVQEEREVPMDRMALTVGVQILIRCGRYLEALETLERFASRPSNSTSSTTEAESTAISTESRSKNPVHLSSISITEVLVSFKRAARPDLVFRLWDHMYPLYGVLHSPESLNVLLQSARLAVVMENSNPRTQLSHMYQLGKRRLFSHSRKSSTDKTQRVMDATPERAEEGLSELRAICAKPEYRGGLWKGKKPEDTAREIFLQVLFGMDAESPSGGLDKVRAPACSVRQDWDSDAGVVGLGMTLPLLTLQRFEYTPQVHMYDWVPTLTSSPEDLDGVPRLVKAPKAHYPHLALTNTNFLNYLSLLGVTRRSGEVALTLAWMKHVGVRPSRSTLALAMVLWGEVSLEGPLVDLIIRRERRPRSYGLLDFHEREEPKDEYERLVFWIEDWVGESGLPTERDLMKWRGIVTAMREARGRHGSDGDNFR